MQLVIDIPDKYMKGMKVENGSLACEYILEAVYNGIPLPKLPKEHEMREATPEELESVNNYIKSISKSTGVNFWDVD